MHKVCILSSVHKRDDTRVFIKEIPSLLKRGYKVSVVLADGKGDNIDQNYEIYDVGHTHNRIFRMISVTKKIMNKAIYIDADIYHFHDPELINIGLKLLRKGKKVIYDVHEDVPRDILSKEYILWPVRKILSCFFEFYEDYASRKFSLIITSTPFIRDRFLKFCKSVADINNYPRLEEFEYLKEWKVKDKDICYVGNITRIRGVGNVVEAMPYVDATLILAGSFDSEDFRNDLKRSPGWAKVYEFGFADRKSVSEIFARSICGLVLFLPEPNHVSSQPNKLFEYMAAGIPVIGSNFNLWKEIIEKNKCGICVDPTKPNEIALAINYLINNKEIAREMGRRGREAIENHYNWTLEEEKLISAYEAINN
jgi:glycosyltransferase involved in cell wall biosynthesis